MTSACATMLGKSHAVSRVAKLSQFGVFFRQLVGGLEPWNFMTFHSVGNVIIPTGPKSIICSEG